MEIGGGQDQGFGGGAGESGGGGAEESRRADREQGRERADSGSIGIPDPGEKDQPAEGGVEEATDGAGRS